MQTSASYATPAPRDPLRAATAALVALALLALTFPALPGVEATSHGGIGFGFPDDDLDEAVAAGIPVKYGALWAGAWNDGNWQGVRDEIRETLSHNATPVIHWYYWGDDISRSCVTNGCWSDEHNTQKTRSTWNRMVGELADVIEQELSGKRAIVTVELEFNKNGITDADYAETFEGYLINHINTLEAVPGVETVVGFGNWGHNLWSRFADAVAASSLMGTQELDSCVRDDITQSAEMTMDGIEALWTTFGPGTATNKQRSMIYDWGLSSWGASNCQDSTATGSATWYQTRQETEIQQLIDMADEMKQYGVEIFIWRRFTDINRTYGYHAQAECCFGFRTVSGADKPALDDVRTWALNEDTEDENEEDGGKPAPEVFEAESFSVKNVGGRVDDASASGGQAWNVWANGSIEETIRVTKSAPYLLTLVAQGDFGGAQYPHMELRLDGVPVHDWHVSTETQWWSFSAKTWLDEGNATLAVWFLNDHNANGEDRNLIVDLLRVEVLDAQAWTKEAEAFDTWSTGASFTDSTASGGSAWNLWTTGSGTTAFHTALEGTQELRIVAKGDVADNAWPIMEALVDGKPVGAWRVSSASWATYTTHVHLGAGNHQLVVKFTNDYNGVNGDRNLRLDKASLWVTPVEWAREGEDLAWGVGGAFTDDAASNRTRWNVWANGTGTATMTTAMTADHELVVVARGQSGNGGWPVMEAWVDGAKVGTWTVDSATFATYQASLPALAEGSHSLEIRYVNDDGSDRNLNVDVVRLRTADARQWQTEAEDLTTWTSGAKSADGQASGGYDWNLWANGTGTATATTSVSGVHELRVVARGTQAAGAWPTMEVRVDGTLVGTYTVDAHPYDAYVASVNLAAGQHTIEVKFTNDLLTSTEDRNLHVDALSLWA